MCGIFGVLSTQTQSSGLNLQGLAKELFLLSESRGKEASGMVTYYGGKVDIAKSAISASEFVRSESFERPFIQVVGKSVGTSRRESFAILGHCRLVTNGAKVTEVNNQPVKYGSVIAIHNGIVVNVDDIWNRHKGLERRSEVDTEVIAALISYYAKSLPLAAAAKKVFGEIEGAASIGLLFPEARKILLATNTGSLYYIFEPKSGLFVFTSERIFLKNLNAKAKYKEQFAGATIRQLTPGIGLLLDIDSVSWEEFDFELSKRSSINATHITAVQSAPESGEEKLFPQSLRRCTKCILPETMPFINFDASGVCSFCRDYVPVKTLGSDALEQHLATLRKSNGQPDIIVTFSGGRDSSYALHLLKHKYGMNPLALTYDWGMVTDLARRNQARICGQLGVEHLLVSADIERKRRNIGRNVKAWLKKPHLGMVPLFMAGDKQFFYYFNKVRRDTGIESVVFSVNPLEKTGFKTGFCQINQGKSVQPYTNKLGVGWFYLSQFLANPAYINPSLVDTFTAYFSAYFLPHDYLLFFDYEDWQEDKINDVLINQYGWEVSPDSSSTWRIGDGTAAFYNYIYHRVAGFTENDTFRSNQVREGYITRGQAITLVEAENTVRIDSIKQYLDLIGLNYDKTIETIDRIPTLY